MTPRQLHTRHYQDKRLCIFSCGKTKMATESDVLSEIEVLQSIYLEELRVSPKNDGEWQVSMDLYPSTAEDSCSQFVRLTLTLSLDLQYPSSSPSISIHNPRGLSDDKLLSLQQCLQIEARSCLGAPVLYQLIEKAKEILTESNIPNGNCVICLYGFQEGEVFTKTSCYHHFHSHCLGRYIAHSETELRQREKEKQEDKTRGQTDGEELSVVCPVCREPLTYDLDVLLTSPAPNSPMTEKTIPGAEFRRKWAELQYILERQRARGGIIDPEAESNRFLIHINEVPPDPNILSTVLDTPSCQSMPPASSTNQLADSAVLQLSGHSKPRRGPGRQKNSQLRWKKRSEIQLQHDKPSEITEEDMGKLTLSSSKQFGFKKCALSACESRLETKVKGDFDRQGVGEAQSSRWGDTRDDRCENICQPRTVVFLEGEAINRPSLDNFTPGSQADCMVSGREQGQRQERGRMKGTWSSGQLAAHWEERSLKGVDQFGSPRDSCHYWRGRGQRGRRGDYNLYHRGRGSSRRIGNSFSLREIEKDEGCDGML